MFHKAYAITVFVLLALTATARADEFAAHFTQVMPPQAMPAFVFEDAHGQSLNIKDFHGHPILLNLWATWCPPCVEEMPSLDKLQSLMGKNLTVIALDEERHGADATVGFFKKHEISNLAIYSDPTGRINSALHARGLPMSFLIDADGHEIGFVEGAVDWAAPDAVRFIKAHLTKSGDTSY